VIPVEWRRLLMRNKKFIVLLMAMVFILGAVSLSFSDQEIKGTVSKIVGNKLTIMDSTGKEKTVKIIDLESLKEIRLGDTVSVKDGKVKKGE
jgi:AAA+ superfamily predicted ATPase